MRCIKKKNQKLRIRINHASTPHCLVDLNLCTTLLSMARGQFRCTGICNPPTNLCHKLPKFMSNLGRKYRTLPKMENSNGSEGTHSKAALLIVSYFADWSLIVGFRGEASFAAVFPISIRYFQFKWYVILML